MSICSSIYSVGKPRIRYQILDRNSERDVIATEADWKLTLGEDYTQGKTVSNGLVEF